MNLLITTQAVDTKDSDLGFFVRWIQEFAFHYEKVTVICLRKGQYSLPHNVEVLSLGKEGGAPRLTRAVRFYRYIFARRSAYDEVFVHMNPEYVVLAGWLWRLWGKKVMLWYTHKSVTLKLRLALFFVNAVVTASPESFRVKSKKVHVLGHGIDTEFFSPDPAVAREPHALSVGRLSKSKRHDVAIEMAEEDARELYIVGEGSERVRLEAFAREHGRVRFLGPLTQEKLRDEYRRASYLIHTSETGSLDKVVLEALACGLPVKTTDPALKFIEHEGVEYVVREHSLKRCVQKIIDLFHSLH